MKDGASALRFGTAVADIRSLVQPAALFFGKCVAYLIAFDTGRTMDIADDDFSTYIGTFTSETFCAEIMWVVEDPLWLYIIKAVEPDLF